MKIFKKSFYLGKHHVTLETGEIARQALGSVVVTIGGTIVLVAVTAKKDNKDNTSNFFPLNVHYQEKAYAAGRIPGSFPRRELRPSELEILIARLIDRPIRPLFPKGFFHTVQIVVTVLLFDSNVQPDIPAIIGASAALMISGLPFNGPLAGIRIGFISGEYILNPSPKELECSDLDLVIAGTKNSILMIESESNNVPEDVILGGILYGHRHMQVIIDAIFDLCKNASKPKWEFTLNKENTVIKSYIKNNFYDDIKNIYDEIDCKKRNNNLVLLKNNIVHNVLQQYNDLYDTNESDIESVIFNIEKEIIRNNILNGKPRIDGRDTRTVRPIAVKIGILPRAHGSALFTRGDTQALVITTLGNDRDAQLIEDLGGNIKNRYILHYNFPPYSVGDTGIIGIPKRREIGHANLAKCSTNAVFPNEDSYPYVVRVVSEITESNGSSSMATVCGASLSMMDAGVPIASPVAGIAMGLVKDKDRFAVLSDIISEEDHLGDMDFKIAGTQYGITALQMDIKIEGITLDIIKSALLQAREGRSHILSIMNETISKHKSKISDYAPQIKVLKVDPARVRDIIGKGGVTIKHITDCSGASIDISNCGEVKIFAKSKNKLQEACDLINSALSNIEIGRVYLGRVVKILDFGIFINILPGKDGLLLFSDLKSCNFSASNLATGCNLNVIVYNIDKFGKIKLLPVVS